MKKSLLLLLMLIGFLFSVTAVQAQENGFGLRAGINTDEVGNEIKIGPHFGVYYNIKTADNFSIQPELLYSVQASEIPVNNGANNPESVVENLSYINIPVMAKLYVAPGLNVQAGPYFGFLMAARADDDADISIKADFSKVDYGLGVGAAYEFPGGFNIGGRYNMGLVNVSDGVNRDGSVVKVNKSFTNRFSQFYIGFTF